MQTPTVTWPGGIGNPAGEKIVTSGGRRKTRRNRKQTRKNRSCRRNRASSTRRNRRS